MYTSEASFSPCSLILCYEPEKGRRAACCGNSQEEKQRWSRSRDGHTGHTRTVQPALSGQDLPDTKVIAALDGGYKKKTEVQHKAY